jgi:hypothetical protein
VKRYAMWVVLLVATPVIFQGAAVGQGASATGAREALKAETFPGADIGDRVNHAASSCPRAGCVIHLSGGNYSFSTPIVLRTGFPVTLICDPGGNQNGGSAATTLLTYTGESGPAITFTASNSAGIQGCTLISSRGPKYPTTGILITSAVGDVFSNIQVGDASGHGFGTGLQISTTGDAVFLDTFEQLYLRGNAVNLNMPYNDGTTNENITFIGGVLSGMAGPAPLGYNQACANIGNFDVHFYGTSFDGCPITVDGGANTMVTFDSDHFEAPIGPSAHPFVLVSPACIHCSVSMLHPNFVEDFPAPGRTSFVSIAGSGMYDFIGPKVLAGETVNAFVTSSNDGAYVLVENPNFSFNNRVTYTIDPGGRYGAANDIEHGVFLTGTQNCAFRFGLGTITGCQSFAALSASRTWTFPNESGTVLVSTSGGDVTVPGSLNVNGGKHFKIDDPLDPANKYLYHTSVESPDMMNIYSGTTVLDSKGEAVVQLPDWFEALNRDFRYQLSCIGRFAPVYVAQEIENNTFRIAGGASGLKVSWQVTAIRHDAYAEAHPSPVEVEKPAGERGHYLHPELFGASQDKAIGAREPGGNR